MKKALELQPDQPHVLNYLGYSWIDQGINLDDGMKMIKRAVDQRPDDGYIVDSLGWAYFRIGNYEEAVKNLERAIDLKPEDPTINDHLGDAYWRVGRTLEAKFQWAHARDLKPEPEELPKIEAKIAERPARPGSSPAATADKTRRSRRKKKQDGRRSQGRRQGRLIETLRGRIADAGADRGWASQGQPDPCGWFGRRGRRLSRYRKRGGVRRLRRSSDLDARRRARSEDHPGRWRRPAARPRTIS